MNASGSIASLIAANVGANAIFSGRVYPDKILQGATYPAAAVNITGNVPTNSKTTASTLDFTRVQVDIYATTPTSAATAAATVRDVIDYYAGTVTLNGGSMLTIKHIQYEGEQNGFSELPELYRVIQQYTIVFA
jgi:hypothetical protein